MDESQNNPHPPTRIQKTAFYLLVIIFFVFGIYTFIEGIFQFFQ